MRRPLVNNKYLLEKFPGKGGWTFAQIPEVAMDTKNPFGWVRVKGTIDGITITGYHLMPMGNGKLFLPVKASIRKKIGKKEGDWIKVVLHIDNDPVKVPEELRECLADEPVSAVFFNSLSNGEKKYYIDWIYSAKKEETKTNRMLRTIQRLSQHLKFHDKRHDVPA